ncbi:tyrosine-protein phosphatase [Flexivirga sp. B27]
MGSNSPTVVDGVANFRSTEGLPAGNGVVRAGRLFRSGSLQAITETGQRTVTDLGVRAVVDLRTDAERSGWPDRVWEGVRVIGCPILDDEQESPVTDTVTDTMADIYRSIIRDRSGQLAAAVRVAMDNSGDGVIVHCYAGTDRTGLVVAIALLAVGVDRDAVIEDYAASHPDVDGRRSATELMTGALTELDRTYGGAAGLLTAGGFTREDLQRLHEWLIDGAVS